MNKKLVKILEGTAMSVALALITHSIYSNARLEETYEGYDSVVQAENEIDSLETRANILTTWSNNIDAYHTLGLETQEHFKHQSIIPDSEVNKYIKRERDETMTEIESCSTIISEFYKHKDNLFHIGGYGLMLLLLVGSYKVATAEEDFAGSRM